jgi:aminoglycoside phosphotransferase (APT) family kinase protein
MMHENELPVDPSTARSLVSSQFPALAGEAISPVGEMGTVNTIYRIGATLAARFPRRAADVADQLRQLQDESSALLELAEHSPFATPRSFGIGEPGEGYPLPWTIQTWVPGEIATPRGLADSHDFAVDLSALIHALRRADTRGRRFAGSGRGGRLRDSDGWVERCLRESEQLVDVATLRSLWADFRELPASSIDVMTHGDLIPANLVVADGRLVGVLDGGGFGPADPALDLVCAWHLLDRREREWLRTDLGCDVAEWRRGAGWALQQALGLVWYYRTSNPAVSELGRSTLDRLLSDPDVRASTQGLWSRREL